MDFTIFEKDNKYAATFQNPTPTDVLHKLATEAELQTTKLNNVETNSKRQGYFFYCFYKAYLQAAAANDNISNLKLDEAIQLITTDPVNTHFLARVLTYYHIKENEKITLSNIRQIYNNIFYPQADKILATKFNINFTSPTSINILTLFNETTPIPSSKTNQNTKSYAESLSTHIPSSSSFNPF
jgi:hypothetical protein